MWVGQLGYVGDCANGLVSSINRIFQPIDLISYSHTADAWEGSLLVMTKDTCWVTQQEVTHLVHMYIVIIVACSN